VQELNDVGTPLIKQVLFCKMVKNFKKVGRSVINNLNNYNLLKIFPSPENIRKVNKLNLEINDIRLESKNANENFYGILNNNDDAGKLKELNNNKKQLLSEKNKPHKNKGKFILKKTKEKEKKKLEKLKKQEELQKRIDKILSEEASGTGIIINKCEDLIDVEDFVNLNEENIYVEDDESNLLYFFKELEGSLKDLKI
jgi:hypothetical protein